MAYIKIKVPNRYCNEWSGLDFNNCRDYYPDGICLRFNVGLKQSKAKKRYFLRCEYCRKAQVK